MSGPVLLPTWEQLAAAQEIVDTMRRYLEQISCVLRPGSVNNTPTGAARLRRLLPRDRTRAAPPPHRSPAATSRNFKPSVGQTPRTEQTAGEHRTMAHRLGTLRMFFVRIEEWGWEQAPPHGADVPR